MVPLIGLDMSRNLRDTLLFVLGATAFLHEVWLSGLDRPSILAAAAAFAGVPLFLRADEKRNGGNNARRG